MTGPTDAPQPATTEDAAERAARAMCAASPEHPGWEHADDIERDAWRHLARAALAAAGAGEAVHGPDYDDPDADLGLGCRCGYNGPYQECPGYRAGAEVDREAREDVVLSLIESGLPREVAERKVGTLLAARGDAATPTVTAEAAAAHHPAKTGWSSRVGEFVICACQANRFGEGPQIPAAEYPTHLLTALGIEVTL